MTESDDIDLDNYCALTNSNIKFISNMRQFLETMKDMTGVDLASLEQAIAHDRLKKNFAEIGNAAFGRVQDLVKDLIVDAFMSIRDYKSIVIVGYDDLSKTSWKTSS